MPIEQTFLTSALLTGEVRQRFTMGLSTECRMLGVSLACAHQMPTDLYPPILPTCDNQKGSCAIFTEGRNCLRYRINMQMMSS